MAQPLCPRRAPGLPVLARVGHRGFTLLELMLVMGLLAVVMGLGLGMFASLNPGRRAAVGLVEGLLRAAHNTAISLSAPARVRIDKADGEILAQGMQVIGTWHFESTGLSGADGLDGVFVGMEGTLEDDGFIGKGLTFEGSPRGAAVEIPIQDDPAFDLREGFSISLAYRPVELRAARLLELGDAFELEVTAGGGLAVTLYRLVFDQLGRPQRGARVKVESAAGMLREGEWARVRAVYDRSVLRILVEEIPVAATATDVPVWKIEGPLVLGGSSTLPSGVLDQLVIAVVAGEQRAVLPKGVVFTPDTPTRIEFAAGGALDPTVHREPVVLGLDFGEGVREDIRVGLYGTVE